jgi:hypothetical protein
MALALAAPPSAPYIDGMRPVLLAVTLALAASPAFAYCPAIPDGPASHYTENQRALMLCQQQELAAAAAQRSRELQYQSDVLGLQIQLEQQLKLQQLAVTIPPVTFPSI